MKDVLVGVTGFVGSNLVEQHEFSKVFHKSDVEQSFGTNPDFLIYAGVPSAMFIANNYPDRDLQIIKTAISNIERINPKHIVLISTIAVYSNVIGVNENTPIDKNNLTAYGRDRRILEEYVETRNGHLIVRLPAIYGKGLKKNFIYDYLHRIPKLLKSEKLIELVKISPKIEQYYSDRGDGFFEYNGDIVNDELLGELKKAGFSSLNFTDSRSIYQFYNLSHLWGHIEKATKLGIKLINIATEPIRISELYKELSGEVFFNEVMKKPYEYDFRTLYYSDFEGEKGYLYNKKTVVSDIKNYIKKEKL